MADVRALLAAERQSRRITHPHLTYTKSGALICNVCQMNVKSETLWGGHLRSANHKRHAQKAQEATFKNLKRKHEVVEDEDETDTRPPPNYDTERRKMPKSRAASLAEQETAVVLDAPPPAVPQIPEISQPLPHPQPQPTQSDTIEPSEPQPQPSAAAATTNQTIDEDEYAAFEREISTLDQQLASASGLPTADYTNATIISAAPISAAQLAEQQAEEKRKQQELLAENDGEDEEQADERGRIEEEFEIMEEMEERVRRLRERREALRVGVGGGGNGGGDGRGGEEEDGEGEGVTPADGVADKSAAKNEDTKSSASTSGSDSESDVDDWYG